MKNHFIRVLKEEKMHPNRNFVSSKSIQKIVIIMKFTFMFLVMSIWGATATSYSQTARLTLQVKNGTVSDVIEEIEKQSEYTFVYNIKEVDLNKTVSVSLKDKLITDVLEKLFNDNSLGYKISDNHIALFIKNSQQQHNFIVSGMVTDENGEPVIGANVVEKGTTNGVVTDVNGEYTLNVRKGAVLLISYVGYISKEVTIVNQRTINIELREDNQNLDEVVVVGYGVQKKSNITGSVASVKPETFKDLDLGVTEIIQGRIAGVHVSNGNIIIRGAASINGSDPLWIVDGVQGSAPNFNDIESIEILKDAASTSIYGARGAGGVILVTTKKGKAGRISVNAKANVGVAMPIDIPTMLSTPDFIDRKLAAGFPNNPASGWDNPSALPNTNWNDEIWGNALKQNYFIQMTGGTEKTSFNMSADYNRNEGFKIGNWNEGASLRIASSTQINKKVKVTEIVSLGFGNDHPSNPLGISYRQVPTMKVYDPENISGGGWGKIGNNTIGQFLYEPSFTNDLLYYSYDGESVQRGFWYGKVANASIKWEEVAQFDLGLEAGFLNNRLNFTAEYYNKNTSDMLYWIGVPISTGASANNGGIPTYPANIGEINNKGFDFMVQYRDSYRDFHYDVAFTLSTNKNKVVKLNDEINPVIWKGPSGDCTWNSAQYRTENGQPMGQLYGYVVDGIFQDQSEIDALNAKAPSGIYQQAGTAPGDFRYKDINKDGEITNEDKDYIGNPWPKLIYGLNISLSWKNFDLIMGWVGNAKFDIFNDAKAYERNLYGDYNTTYKVYEAWTPQNPSIEHPRVLKEDPNGNFKNFSSYFVEDGSYFKLKNLHIGYNLPKSLLNKFYIQGLKVFINCNNILTFSKFQGDPELSGGYLERTTYSSTRFPASKSVMGGISLTL